MVVPICASLFCYIMSFPGIVNFMKELTKPCCMESSIWNIFFYTISVCIYNFRFFKI